MTNFFPWIVEFGKINSLKETRKNMYITLRKSSVSWRGKNGFIYLWYYYMHKENKEQNTLALWISRLLMIVEFSTKSTKVNGKMILFFKTCIKSQAIQQEEIGKKCDEGIDGFRKLNFKILLNSTSLILWFNF